MTHFVHKSIQESLYALLTGDATLSGIVAGIYDRVPESPDYPYIVIDNLTSRDWSTRTSLGFNTQVPMVVYGQTGTAELLEILDRIYELVVEGNITLLNHQLVALKFETHNLATLEDGITKRGNIRFRAYSEFIPV